MGDGDGKDPGESARNGKCVAVVLVTEGRRIGECVGNDKCEGTLYYAGLWPSLWTGIVPLQILIETRM